MSFASVGMCELWGGRRGLPWWRFLATNYRYPICTSPPWGRASDTHLFLSTKSYEYRATPWTEKARKKTRSLVYAYIYTSIRKQQQQYVHLLRQIYQVYRTMYCCQMHTTGIEQHQSVEIKRERKAINSTRRVDVWCGCGERDLKYPRSVRSI